MRKSIERLLPFLVTGVVITAVFIKAKLDAMTAPEFSVLVLEVKNPEAPQSQWTLQPLSGVDVTARWGGSKREDPLNFHSGNRRCMGTKTARTNQDGKAVFPAWRARWGDHVLYPSTTPNMAGYVEIQKPGSLSDGWQTESNLHVLRRASAPEMEHSLEASDIRCESHW